MCSMTNFGPAALSFSTFVTLKAARQRAERISISNRGTKWIFNLAAKMIFNPERIFILILGAYVIFISKREEMNLTFTFDSSLTHAANHPILLYIVGQKTKLGTSRHLAERIGRMDDKSTLKRFCDSWKPATRDNFNIVCRLLELMHMSTAEQMASEVNAQGLDGPQWSTRKASWYLSQLARNTDFVDRSIVKGVTRYSWVS